MKPLIVVFTSILLASMTFAETQPEKKSLVERVGDTGFVRVDASSFSSLTAKQQELAYWLAQASIAIDPIIYDQFSRFGLRQKRLLEGIVAHSGPDVNPKIVAFTKLFWANRGNHNDNTSQKFTPEFTFEELQQAALAAQKKGAFKTACGDLPLIEDEAALNKELEDLRASLFDPHFEPMITAKSPEGGLDIIQASSNTFYPGLSLAELKEFKDKFPLNSRVVKGPDGKLDEQVYRAGTPDGSVPPGLYATYLKKANEYLAKAQKVAEPEQAKVIGNLIRFYQTGDPKDWLEFGKSWVQNDAAVDFVHGFVEVYRDARGAKGSAQSFVSITDKKQTEAIVKLAANAGYFEQKAPWDAKYKKQTFTPPVVKAVETVVETADYGVTTIGVNLPNENEIRETYGSKNFLFASSVRALNDAQGKTAVREFAASDEVAERAIKHGEEAADLHTALHEVIGHGSGKLADRLKGGAEPYLKEYFSTMEEARADLISLWNVWDPKMKELGLVSDQEQVAKAMYDSSTLVALTQLRRIPRGSTIEEDHQRNRQMIVNYIRDKVPGAIEQFERDGKTYIQVKDYEKMREGVGMMLAEVMRIKGEGDYDAIKAMVDKYGVRFDTAVRDQIVTRYKKLNLPTYWAGVNSILKASFGKNGEVEKVEISYPKELGEQYLMYASMYDGSLKK